MPAAWLTLCIVWSSTWLVIKIGLRDLPPISYAGIRFLIAIIVLLAVSFGRVRLLPTRASDYAVLALTGILMFAVNYGLLFWGELRVSSGLAAVLRVLAMHAEPGSTTDDEIAVTGTIDLSALTAVTLNVTAIGGGVISFVAAHWNEISRGPKIAMLFTALLAFHIGQERVLLGAVKAVDLVDKEDGLPSGLRAFECGFLGDLADVRDSRGHRIDARKTRAATRSDEVCERGLPHAGRPVEDERHETIGLDGPPKELARTEDMLLSDEFGQVPRPHPPCKGRLDRLCRKRQTFCLFLKDHRVFQEGLRETGDSAG